MAPNGYVREASICAPDCLHWIQEGGSRCSVFTFDINPNRSRLALAKNTVRKLRTIRHPGVIRVLDTIEVDDCILMSFMNGLLKSQIDRHSHLRGDGAACTTQLAYQKEKLG